MIYERPLKTDFEDLDEAMEVVSSLVAQINQLKELLNAKFHIADIRNCDLELSIIRLEMERLYRKRIDNDELTSKDITQLEKLGKLKSTLLASSKPPKEVNDEDADLDEMDEAELALVARGE